MTFNISVLVSGRGTNFQSIANAIRDGTIPDSKIVAVISDKKNAYALKRAEKEGIENIFIDPEEYGSREDFDQQVIRILDEKKTDLVLLAGYLRIISDPLIEAYKGRIINIHPSLLPSFKGLHAHRQTLEYGVKVSGCTVHFVEPSLDSGPIIIQRTVPVLPDDNEESLSARILKEEHIAYPEAVRLFVEKKLEIRGRNVVIHE